MPKFFIAIVLQLEFLVLHFQQNQFKIFKKYNDNKSLFLEIDLKKSLAKAEDLNFQLDIKESSKKMFLSGEWDATSTLLENENLIEKKINDLPYLKFGADL